MHVETHSSIDSVDGSSLPWSQLAEVDVQIRLLVLLISEVKPQCLQIQPLVAGRLVWRIVPPANQPEAQKVVSMPVPAFVFEIAQVPQDQLCHVTCSDKPGST